MACLWRSRSDVELLPFLRQSLLGLLGSGLGLALMAAIGRSDEVAAGASGAAGLVIHGPAETLRHFCHQENGALWLVLPGGARFELLIPQERNGLSKPA